MAYMHTAQQTFLGCIPPQVKANMTVAASNFCFPGQLFCCWALLADTLVAVTEQGHRPSLNTLVRFA